ncbi:MAG: PKD domain-containing protein [Thermoplasmatota archaeon]
MKTSRSWAVPVLLVAVALAGCTDSGDSGSEPIKVSGGKDPVTDAFTFKATMGADTYTWNFGDGTPPATGKTVEHTFGFTDGTVTVRLVADKAGETTDYEKQITLGSGTNTPPELVLEANTDWLLVGEEGIFSGASSTDADGDPLVFSWICFRKGDLSPAHGGHAHGGGFEGGVEFGSGSAATVPSRIANGTLPTPDRMADGDFCDSFGTGSQPGRDATVGGSFTQSGVYQVTMLAGDPKMPAVAGEFTVYVSDERPPERIEASFAGTFAGGDNGQVQDLMDQLGDPAGQSPYDRVEHSFALSLPNKATYFNVTGEGVTYTIYQDGSPKLVDLEGNQVIQGLAAGNYRIVLKLAQGLQVDYTVDVVGIQDVRPANAFEPL